MEGERERKKERRGERVCVCARARVRVRVRGAAYLIAFLYKEKAPAMIYTAEAHKQSDLMGP